MRTRIRLASLALAAALGGCASVGYEPVVGAATACEHLDTQAYLNCLESIENTGLPSVDAPSDAAVNALIQQYMWKNYYDRLNQPIYVIPLTPYPQRW